MPIQIVKQDERLRYENDGSVIYYRRIPAAKRSYIVKIHTKKGKTDWGAVVRDVLEYITLGWENVQDSGKDIPFSIDAAMYLPDDVIGDLLDLSGANISKGEETPGKNSKTT